MKKLNLALIALLLVSNVAQASGTGSACAVQCNGDKPVTPFDFYKKAQSAGDPNTGKPLDHTILVPSDPNNPNAPMESIITDDYFNGINSFEEWTAKNCGESLNDNNGSDVIVVSKDCTSTNEIERQKLWVSNLHSPKGTPTPPLLTIKKVFDAVTSPAGQKKYQEALYIQRESTKAVDQELCEESKPSLGDSNFNVFVNAKQCRKIFIPGTKDPIMQKSLPLGVSTSTTSEVESGFTIFGSDYYPIKMKGTYTAPNGGSVSANHTINSFGIELINETENGNAGANKVSIEKIYPLAEISRGGEKTFFIGPIPVTVSAYAHGTLSAAGLAKVAPVYANGSVSQTINTWLEADAHVGLVIAKAGIEVQMTLIKDSIYAYGFMGIVPMPTVYDGINLDMFKVSSQSNGVDDFHALSGYMNVYAAIRRPKWFGFKWKKYVHEIYSNKGSHETGYLFSNTTGPVDIADLFH